MRFQRLPPARGGTAQRKIFHLANWSQHIHPGPSSSRSRFFMESSQLYAATLTHFSTEPLTTGPDYDPLLLLLALAGDVHPNPGPSTYPCSVCFRNVGKHEKKHQDWFDPNDQILRDLLAKRDQAHQRVL